MEKLGKFKIISQKEKTEINLDDLNPGINNLKDHIINFSSDKHILYVIDKICDHAGGKLIPKGNMAICPMHSWTLNLDTLEYNDSHICKKEVDYHQINETKIELPRIKSHLVNPYLNKDKSKDFTLRWLNHACIYIECNGISLITDPWLFGPAFMTGWWLSEPSPIDSLNLLKKADFVYISHNHPDHLHPETLNLIDKDKKIIVGNFNTNSTEKFLKALGFRHLIPLDFNEIHEIIPGFQISILKSGDFRDDSGIYINLNGSQILLTVDCNYLNSHVLPRDIDLLMTSFAGGASGFPLCFDNYDLSEKQKIIKRNKSAIRSMVIDYIKATNPTYYMPYAGMFKEVSERDSFILINNTKNSIQNYYEICSKMNVKYFAPKKNTCIQSKNNILNQREIDVELLSTDDTSNYINEYKKDFHYSPAAVISYFEKSGYYGNQIVQIIPTNDSFDRISGEIVYADFKNQIFKTITENELIDKKEESRVMKLYVRKEIIACVIENQLPWEDLSIGFQMRVQRHPNEYESDFWYHFTNEYINSIHFRHSAYCGACTVINQNPIWNKVFKKNQ